MMYTLPSNGSQEPEHVARYLTDPIAATWGAFDRGRAVADEFFSADERREYDPHLWAHLARYEAALSLDSETKRGWTVRSHHHSGIEILMEPFTIKVCKATDGGPQSPGRNRARREFFQQLGLTLFHGSTSTNLILYWRVRAGDLELGLCKPKGLWRFRGQPKLEWRRPVSFDPLAGLTFPSADDEDVEVLRFDEGDLGDEETG